MGPHCPSLPALPAPLWTAALLLPLGYGFCEAHCPFPQLMRSRPPQFPPGWVSDSWCALMYIVPSSLERRETGHTLDAGLLRRLASLCEEICPVPQTLSSISPAA